MNRIETTSWKSYKIIDLFEVRNTHSILKNEIEEDSGRTPYVTASNDNNGIYTYVLYNDDLKEQGNCIMIGGKTLTITYQKEDFFSNDSHNLALYLKNIDYRTEKVQLFLITALRASIGHTYSWGDSISSKSIQKDVINLPADKDGNPNFSYMEEYMKNQEVAVIASLTKMLLVQKSKKKKIDMSGWGEFEFKDLFFIKTCKSVDRIRLNFIDDGQYEFIGRTPLNNGIQGKINRLDFEPNLKGTYSVAQIGEKICQFRENDWYASQNVFCLTPIDARMNIANKFITTIITQTLKTVYGTDAYSSYPTLQTLPSVKIKLPVNSEGEPDYLYMEEFMNNIFQKTRYTFSKMTECI